jgi:Phage integrase, N-terminal SAM-like domain
MNTTIAVENAVATTAAPSRFLTQLHDGATRHGHGEAGAAELVNWCRRFILFHGTKHPQEMGQTEVNAYLQHIAKTAKDPLLGIAAAHGALETTMIYTHVARKGPAGVTSPLDLLGDVSADDLRDAVNATRRLG